MKYNQELPEEIEKKLDEHMARIIAIKWFKPEEFDKKKLVDARGLPIPQREQVGKIVRQTIKEMEKENESQEKFEKKLTFLMQNLCNDSKTSDTTKDWLRVWKESILSTVKEHYETALKRERERVLDEIERFSDDRVVTSTWEGYKEGWSASNEQLADEIDRLRKEGEGNNG